MDGLGCMALDRRSAELLFQALTERGEKASGALQSPPTSPSPAGPRPSPTHVSAPPSSTATFGADSHRLAHSPGTPGPTMTDSALPGAIQLPTAL